MNKKEKPTISLEARVHSLGVKGLKKFVRVNKGLVQDLLKARKFAESERERVDAYTLPILLAANLKADLRSSDGTRMIGDGEQITDRREVYLCSDEEACHQYFEACNKANVEHGWTGDPRFCPALVAEDQVCRLECGLIQRFADVCNCPEFTYCSLEHRKDLLDLLVRMCTEMRG